MPFDRLCSQPLLTDVVTDRLHGVLKQRLDKAEVDLIEGCLREAVVDVEAFPHDLILKQLFQKTYLLNCTLTNIFKRRLLGPWTC